MNYEELRQTQLCPLSKSFFLPRARGAEEVAPYKVYRLLYYVQAHKGCGSYRYPKNASDITSEAFGYVFT